jgi:hypothetical protein
MKRSPSLAEIREALATSGNIFYSPPADAR